MVALPIPVSSSPGIKSQEGAGRLINCFAEKTETGTRFPVVWRRSAGLSQINNDSVQNHLRGAIKVGTTLVCVFNPNTSPDKGVYTVTETLGTFTAVNRGKMDGTGAITIARNNRGTPGIWVTATAYQVADTVTNAAVTYICIVAHTSAALFATDLGTSKWAVWPAGPDIVAVDPNLSTPRVLFTDTTAPADYPDSDLPASPNSVSVLDGYLLFTYANGDIYASELNSLNVHTNSHTTVQTRPGGLLRGVSFGGRFFAFGPSACDVYRDVGASPFPLEFDTFLARGIAGTFAVAGWEEGWSNELIWVGDDAGVYQLSGNTPMPIANDDVSRDIFTALKDGLGSVLEASVYMQGRHAFWRLTNPGEWTWEYNATTQNWNERLSYGRSDCRASGSVRAFDRWVMGDRTTGKLFELDPTYYKEGDDALTFQVDSGALAAFPSRLGAPRLDLDMTSAVGVSSGEDPIQTDPSVLISISGDGGFSYGSPVTRHLGGEGDAEQNVSVLRCGKATGKGYRVRIQVSDPVHVALMGGQMAVEQRGE